MDDYRQYDPEQLAADTSFRNWKLFQAEEDTLFWENWLLLNPDKQDDVKKAELLLEFIFSHYDQINDSEIRSGMEQIAARIGGTESVDPVEEDSFPLWKKILRVAAAVVLVASGWYFLQTTNPTKPSEAARTTTVDGVAMKEEHNNSDRKKLVLLSDGSTVLMMPKSTLYYPESFSGANREVRFVGEGFFEIARNPEKPFFVYTDQFVTKVLGTSFTIRSFEGEEASVVVRTGSVSVYKSDESASPGDQVILLQNEKITFSKQEPLKVRRIPEEEVLASSGHQNLTMEFIETPVSEVFRTLEKIYEVPIRFDKGSMENCFLTASLEHEPFFKKLDLICRTLDAHYQIEPDGDVTVFGTGCR